MESLEWTLKAFEVFVLYSDFLKSFTLVFLIEKEIEITLKPFSCLVMYRCTWFVWLNDYFMYMYHSRIFNLNVETAPDGSEVEGWVLYYGIAYREMGLLFQIISERHVTLFV